MMGQQRRQQQRSSGMPFSTVASPALRLLASALLWASATTTSAVPAGVHAFVSHGTSTGARLPPGRPPPPFRRGTTRQQRPSGNVAGWSYFRASSSPPSLLPLGLTTTTALAARRGKNRGDDDELNRWYDEVDENATPDKVFWDEMERQRSLLNNNAGGGSGEGGIGTASAASQQQPGPVVGTYPNIGDGPAAADQRQPVAVVDSVGGDVTGGGGGGGGPPPGRPYAPLPMSGFGGMVGGSATGGGSSSRLLDQALMASSSSPMSYQNWRRAVPTMEQIKMAEATLSEYELYRVSDNWLDETLQLEMGQMEASSFMNDDNDDDGGADVDVDDDDWGQRLEGGRPADAAATAKRRIKDDGRDPDSRAAAMDFLADNNEPWQYFGEDKVISSEDRDRQNAREVPFPSKDSEFYFDPYEVIDPEEVKRYEQALAERMRDCKTRSKRLAKAEKSAKAREFFARGPNTKEGYEHLWVAAVDNASFQALVGSFRDYGVEFADNFGDFFDHSAYDGLYSVEDMAAWKARQVHRVTGLPVIASRTSFEVEPVPPSAVSHFRDSMTGSTNRAAAATRMSNPKVLSGYKINDVAMHVDYLTEALRPLSEPNRVTRFTTCMCFYDGEMEIFEHGVCDVDIHFCNSMRTFIPVAQAMNHMMETLKMTFDLEYQKFLRIRMDDAQYGSAILPGSASVKLRDRVLKDARVLPNDIIDVSKFMDSQVDVNLMDDCARELAERFMNSKPSKIMTVATTGLVIALPMAKYLQVPVVYARKERNVVMADTYSAAYSSKTVGKNRQLLVSKSHLHEDDRVLVVDDFLSSGASQEALLRIISDAGAKAVGIGVLLEKAYDSGRQSLSGFDLPIQSLCRVASVKGGILQLVEEEGYDKMN